MRRARSPQRRSFPLTVANLTERVKSVWQALGLRAFDAALAELKPIEHELAGLVEAAR